MVASDHVPLLLTCTHGEPQSRPSRLESFWMRYEEFNNISDEVFAHPGHDWMGPDPVTNFNAKLQTLHSRLRTWHKYRFLKSDSYLDNCKALISFFDALEEVRILTDLERFVRLKVKEHNFELMTNEEMKWRQRARCRWLSQGDKNTRYFHAIASAKARKRAITEIIHQGNLITDKHQITHTFLVHYQELLGTSVSTTPLDLAPLYEQPVDLSQLDAPFSLLEVHQAVRQLAPNKASGPDGLPNEFAKIKWNTIQPYVMQFFHKLYTHQLDLTGMNEATIVLLPKHEAAQTVTDYRPISIINLIPKLISKVLANRIRPFLPQLVNEHQTAFVHGRFIAENFLATREVLRHVHQTKSPAVLLKLDFAKAYDTLDWNFLTRVLQVRGFPDKVVQWIIHSLSTASSRIMLNGQLSGSFKHKRGLRQGDPLSPYLFIIAADVFQKMTTKISLASPHRLSSRLPLPIINFQYADDTVLIAAAKGQNLLLLVIVIHCFTAAFGLKVNLDKNSFVPIAIQDRFLGPIQQLLQCTQSSLPIKYLGMPLTIKNPTKTDFMPMLDKLEKRLQRWKARLISRAGRLQLVKSVLSVIPMYFMSCFKLPKWLLNRIDSVRRQFLWSRGTNVQAISLIN